MTIEVKRTSSLASSGVKMLVYGQAGAGKTTLIKTLPNPIILSAEGGLMSIQDDDIPFITVSNMDDLKDAYRWLVEHRGDYSSIALDSISEVAEIVLSAEKKKAKDPRQAYGALQ